MAKATKARTKTMTSAKKATKKPASAAKHITRKRVAKSAANPQFFEFRLTEQSLYWLIFGAASIMFTIWVYSLDARVRDLYDQIDMSSYTTDSALQIQASKRAAEKADQ